MEKSKYNAQIKHLRNKYVRFTLDLLPEQKEQFHKVCKANNTTATTELKKFIDMYIEKNKKYL